MKNKRKNSGFTLIELVVVVAIIGVLAAIVTPKVRTSLMKAKDAKIVATLDALRTASNVYYAEKGIPPYNTDGKTVTVAAAAKDSALTIGQLALLVKNGYLDKASAQKFFSGTSAALDTLIAAADPGVAAGGTTALLTLPATVQTNVTTDCTAEGVVGSNPTFTQAFVGYVWDADGIGIKLGTSAASTTAAVVINPATPTYNTNCELWANK